MSKFTRLFCLQLLFKICIPVFYGKKISFNKTNLNIFKVCIYYIDISNF